MEVTDERILARVREIIRAVIAKMPPDEVEQRLAWCEEHGDATEIVVDDGDCEIRWGGPPVLAIVPLYLLTKETVDLNITVAEFPDDVSELLPPPT